MGTIMDNHSINYTALLDKSAPEHIRCALIMMLAGDKPEDVTHYGVCPIEREGLAAAYLRNGVERRLETLILYRNGPPGSNSFAFPQSLDDLTHFIHGWIRNATYGPEPDIDGSCEKGYRLFTDEYGDVNGHRTALIAAQPEWAILHV